MQNGSVSKVAKQAKAHTAAKLDSPRQISLTSWKAHKIDLKAAKANENIQFNHKSHFEHHSHVEHVKVKTHVNKQ